MVAAVDVGYGARNRPRGEGRTHEGCEVDLRVADGVAAGPGQTRLVQIVGQDPGVVQAVKVCAGGGFHPGDPVGGLIDQHACPGVVPDAAGLGAEVLKQVELEQIAGAVVLQTAAPDRQRGAVEG